MKHTDSLFLSILKAALEGEQLAEAGEMTPEQWNEIFLMADAHKVLPLVYQAAYTLMDPDDAARIRSRVRKTVMLQTLKTHEFLLLNENLREAGCEPIVVKGLVCRNLYPQPDLRPSSDEDILIPEAQFADCCRVLREFGMDTDVPEEKWPETFEVPFRKKDSPLFLEVHKSLFAPNSEAYGHWNRFFDGARERAIRDGDVLTLSETDHLFYLLCHAFKHFIHSGFGIRQVCDIVLYANKKGQAVDWKQVYDNCCKIRAEYFAAALFRIGESYLGFDPVKAGYPAFWQELSAEETDMLMDLLSAGVYGSATRSRVHSSNLTLDAVSADRKGKQRVILKNSLFPSAKSLTGRYPYLEKRPWLLPVAWTGRILSYLKETGNTRDNSAAQSLQIGKERIELLRKYRVIR